MNHNHITSTALMLLASLATGLPGHAQGTADKTLTPEMLRMPRQQISFEDPHVILFNGRGSVNPRQYSMTGFMNLKFYPIDLWDYDFHFHFRDEGSGTLIRDDVPALWKQWIETRTGSDPLGSNFRPNFATVVVTQDEWWQPNQYYRSGTFHKQYGQRWVSFGIETWTAVSGEKDEIFVKIRIRNRDKQALTLTLMPQQSAGGETSPSCADSGQQQAATFLWSREPWGVTVSSDLESRSEDGFQWTIPGGGSATQHFAIAAHEVGAKTPSLHQRDIAERMERALAHTRRRLQWAADRLPAVQTDSGLLNDFYRRCILTVMECKWERENFIANPFWAVGSWLFTITWDNSFTARVLAMLDAESLKETIKLPLREGRLERTYIGWAGAAGDILYLQEPFALQTMIEAYLDQTGDMGILSEKAGDATVYEWMKRWARTLHDEYGRPDGLIDVGASTEKIIEIRTDGYNHVVPIINGLAIDLYRRIAAWGQALGDDEAANFRGWADQLQKSFEEKLWNGKEGWYDNLYPDGSRAAVWTYHLFDLLGVKALSNDRRERLISHIREGVFLGRFGFYSLARTDRVHWDRIDADWGGGGQYAGMTPRIALNLYHSGHPALAWDVLQRYAGYVNHFPYLSQNPRTDRPLQDLSSMALEISAGAGIEAILFGIFGLRPMVDGALEIDPAYNPALGTAKLSDYRFRGHAYDVLLAPGGYEVWRDEATVAQQPYGTATRLE